jgi:predicted alpha/beta-fold hydrolase
MNMRGAGESEALCPRLYHAGVDTDLLAALKTVAARTPRLAPLGFSLGANLVLLTLGRQAGRIPSGVFAAAAVSPPLDLAACADALGRAGGRIYERHYVRDLQRAYRRRQALLPELYAAGRERGLSSIREYDDAITAHYGGFRDAADYYERSSAGPQLVRIDRPTLILSAADDPMIPGESVARWPLPPSGLVRREILPTGGHVGFVAATSAPGRFWAAERVMEFLEGFRPAETRERTR